MLKDFDYYLPPHLIAQFPPAKREDSRLMVVDRRNGALEHAAFTRLPDHLRRGDVLVVNETRVLPARLIGKKASGGKVEVLLVRKRKDAQAGARSGEWDCLARSSGALRPGTQVAFDSAVKGELLEKTAGGLWRLFISAEGDADLAASLGRIGLAPLPPYIHRNGDETRRTADLERYQTVYARKDGAIAAPTAGLHFSRGLLGEIEEKGVRIVPVTLHVGIGTFLPVKVEQVENHRLEPEFFEVSQEAAEALRAARAEGRRIIGVGTTVVRALESAVDPEGGIQPCRGETGLFILPGHRFRAVDALITNFHLPRSTLLMLVSAFAGKDLVLAAYREAIRENYRFYSYGDAMLIL